MAKKAVATQKSVSAGGRTRTQCIKMVKSPKTGAYSFKTEMVQNDQVEEFFKK